MILIPGRLLAAAPSGDCLSLFRVVLLFPGLQICVLSCRLSAASCIIDSSQFLSFFDRIIGSRHCSHFRPPHLLEASLFAEPAVALHVLAAGFLFVTVARGSSFPTCKYY
ncbi:hypothetical protein BJX62DRAFT_188913 [Aspergillus germanicus]